MRRQRSRAGSFIKTLTLGVLGSPQTLLWVDWFHQKASNLKKFAVLVLYLLLSQSDVATFCRDRRLLALRWTSSFQLSLAPSQLSPSCFSSPSSLWRRRSHSWSMTLKRPRATVTRARSSNQRRSSQVQQDRERHFAQWANNSFRIYHTRRISSRVDPNCPKMLNDCHWKCCEWPMHNNKNSYIIYQLFWIYSLKLCLSYRIYVVVRLW